MHDVLPTCPVVPHIVTHAVAFMKAAVHAVYPCWYESSTSDVARDLQALLDASGCRDGGEVSASKDD